MFLVSNGREIFHERSKEFFHRCGREVRKTGKVCIARWLANVN